MYSKRPYLFGPVDEKDIYNEYMEYKYGINNEMCKLTNLNIKSLSKEIFFKNR